MRSYAILCLLLFLGALPGPVFGLTEASAVLRDGIPDIEGDLSFMYLSRESFAAPLKATELVEHLNHPERFEAKRRGELSRWLEGRYHLRLFVVDNLRQENFSIALMDKIRQTSAIYHHSAYGLETVDSLSMVGSTYVLNLYPGRNYFVLQLRSSSTRDHALAIFAKLVNVPSALSELEKQAAIITSISGAILAIACYSLGMYTFARRRYFLSYLIYVLAALFGLLLLYGVNFGSTGSSTSLGVALMLAASALIVFSNSILSMRTHSPKAYKASYGLIVLNVVLILIGTWTTNLLPNAIASLLSLLFCTTAASIASARRFKPARYLLAGWSIFFLTLALRTADMFYFKTDNIFLFYFPLFGFAIEVFLFTFAISMKSKLAEQKANQQSQHAFSQLSKVVYPHQIMQIRQSAELEETMPTGGSEACVICFDIVGSSKLDPERAKEAFRSLFRRCNAVMMEGYDGEALRAAGYRIKELGDGFLCSVGYPFASLTGMVANDALDLAYRFLDELNETPSPAGEHRPLFCGIGLAMDRITGFYPNSGAREYDLFGRAIVLAKRYEGMRKAILSGQESANIIVLQEKIYASLDDDHRKGFVEFDLLSSGSVVRDDPSAQRLYYRIFKAQEMARQGEKAAG